MSDHLTEEEQLEALKRWWKENGKLIVLAVVVSAGGYFGWGAWQDHQRTQAETASVQFEALLNQMDTDEAGVSSELVDEIKQIKSNSLYAYNAAFLKAQAAVRNDDLDTAAAELEWILNANPEESVALLARVRLARVLNAQAEYAEALTVLSAVEPPASFASRFAEVRGDVLLGQGDHTGARAAYQMALEGLGAEAQSRASLLEMKLDNLATAAADEQDVASGENAS